MPPAGDFIRIQIDLEKRELRNYVILWSNEQYRVSTTIFGHGKCPNTQDIARGLDLAEGFQIFANRLTAYIAERSEEIQAEVTTTAKLADLERPGFRPGYFRKLASQQARQYKVWKSCVEKQITDALNAAKQRDWPVVPIRMPWSIAREAAPVS